MENRIRELRKAAGLRQEDLARLLAAFVEGIGEEAESR